MEKKRTRYKWIAYISFIFIAMVLQTTVLPYVRILGGTPSIMPYAVAVIAMFEGIYGGAAAGLAAGIISDAMLSPSEGFYTVMYVICGVVVSLMCNVVFWKNYGVTLLYGAVAILLTGALYYVIFMLLFGQTNILPVVQALPYELLTTLIFTPFVYLIIRSIYRRFLVEEET